ncbi:FHA domain-containing protein, partial [Streptomyces sp. ISL-43]|uniref:FHA domain-containing protein n=1 Tax=Streptomyces sp. ISL-43 TaxID=2819183 RepID=UPI001BE66FEA
MQIRLTVLGSGSRSGHLAASTTASGTGSAPAGCDVLVTAPAGTALSAVASGLAATVGGPDTGGTVVLYAGTERLDPGRSVLGEPPLVDGAVLSLNVPGPHVLADAETGDGPQLHVVAGPDAGGVHLLHPGAIRIGRSADADVPLDDPDVSRLHCTVTVLPDGRVAVADLGSTNGTTLDGWPVGADRVALAPGALLQVGESTLRLAVGPQPSPLPLTPDLEGHFALALPGGPRPQPPNPGGTSAAAASTAPGTASGSYPDAASGTGRGTGGDPRGLLPRPAGPAAGRDGVSGEEHRRQAGSSAPGAGPSGPAAEARGTGWDAATGPAHPAPGDSPATGPGSGAPGAEQHSGVRDTGHRPGTPGVEHYGASGWDSAPGAAWDGATGSVHPDPGPGPRPG